LVDARSGYHIWSGSYQRELDDIFQLQNELARAIVRALRVELGVEHTEPLIAEQTRSPEGYNWFIRGRSLLDWASPENLYQSISYFEKAVEVDPDYAMAWGYLAFARSLTALWQATEEVSSSTILAYERALALNPDQSEALAAKAWMTLILKYDWEAAGKLYQQAMASSENANAMVAYAVFYLAYIDRISQAIGLYTAAEKRDPLHAGYKANLAHLLRVSGDAEAAILKAQEALELNPQHWFALTALLQGHALAGNCPAALEILQSLPSALQQLPRMRAGAALCYFAQGDHGKASEIYRDLVEATLPSFGRMIIAQLALSLGEVEEAIGLMEREVEDKSWSQFLSRNLFRHNDAVKDHPRYLALLKRIGLDDESVAALHRKMSFD
jgi:tetratricopeptide (TPR) repeat protein